MSQGKLVAARTITILVGSSSRLDIPSICTSSSDLTLLLASCSLSLPRLEQRLSISSMKMVLGA